jgi:hypothetical protein
MGAYPSQDARLGSNSAISESALCTSAGRSAFVRRPRHGVRRVPRRFRFTAFVNVLRKPRSGRQIKNLQTPLKWYLQRRSSESWLKNVRHCLRWPQTTEIHVGGPVNSVHLGN